MAHFSVQETWEVSKIWNSVPAEETGVDLGQKKDSYFYSCCHNNWCWAAGCESRPHDLERNLDDAGRVSDKSPANLQSKELSQLYSWCFTRYVYFFCAMRKQRLPDCPEEDPLLFWLGEEWFNVKHTVFTQLYFPSGASKLDQGSKHISTLTKSLHCSSLGGEMVCLQYFWFYLLTPSGLAESAYMELIWMEQNKPVQGIFLIIWKSGVNWEQPCDVVTTLTTWRSQWVRLVVLDEMLTWQNHLSLSPKKLC